MCRSRSSLIGGAKKSHGKISRPNPIGKHIQVLQQNLRSCCRAALLQSRQKLTHDVTSPTSIDALRKVHSITSSAIESTAGGTSMPSARAV